MSTIALDDMNLRLEFGPPGVRLSTSAGPVAVLEAPELIRRPDELRCWVGKPQSVLVLTATHASRLFRVVLETGAAEVAATLNRRYSPVLGDQLQFLTCKRAGDGTLLLLYETGLLCLDPDGMVRWHRLHNDVTATFACVDGEYVCIEGCQPVDGAKVRTYFRLEDGEEIPAAA